MQSAKLHFTWRRPKRKSDEIDMLTAPLFSSLLRFAVPGILMGFLQLLFSTIDLVMAGAIVGDGALAAVGTTISYQYIFINLYMGLGVAVNVIAARAYGAGNEERTRRCVHTAVPFSLLLGAAGMLLGLVITPYALHWLNTPTEVYADALLYARVCFLGAVPISLYHCCSGIMRAYGDTKRPFYFLFLSGSLNLAFNAFFLMVIPLGILGVALGTILSQTVSAALVLVVLLRRHDVFALHPKQIRLEGKYIKSMVQIGLPVSVQSICYSLCNVMIQGKINLFGPLAMSGNTAASSLGDYEWALLNAWSQTIVSFVGQNAGAKQYRRAEKILYICLACALVSALLLVGGLLLFASPLLSLYTDSAEAIAFGVIHARTVFPLYFVYGIALVLAGFLQGLGYSFLPMLANVLGICGIRLLWVWWVFPARENPSLAFLYNAYPLSWLATLVIIFFCTVFCYRRLKRREGLLK